MWVERVIAWALVVSLLAMIVSGTHLHIMQAQVFEARNGPISYVRRISACHASACTQLLCKCSA